MKYDQHKKPQKSKKKKVEVQDGEVVMEECSAYGKVQVRIEVPATSFPEIEVPSVYEAIWCS